MTSGNGQYGILPLLWMAAYLNLYGRVNTLRLAAGTADPLFAGRATHGLSCLSGIIFPRGSGVSCIEATGNSVCKGRGSLPGHDPGRTCVGAAGRLAGTEAGWSGDPGSAQNGVEYGRHRPARFERDWAAGEGDAVGQGRGRSAEAEQSAQGRR